MPKTNDKDAYFFSHDCNARNDPKILALRSVYGAEGYGVYFMLVEILREQPEYKLSVTKYIWSTLATTKGRSDMRNIDKIKSLEKELGRYRKAVADRDKLLRKRGEELERAHAGALQLQAATDALISSVALAHGEEIIEDGERLGWRLTVQKFDVEEVRKGYEVHARRDEKTGDYIVGVVPRENQE